MVKLYSASSISGPSRISKPMPTKMSLISSSTMYIGCWWPSSGALPGMVTSSASALRRISSMRALSASRRCSSAVSSSARTWFASWPMAGRSSADRRPICLRMAVSSPFLPRYFTRRFSSAVMSSACKMASTEATRSFCSISFMQTTPSLQSLRSRSCFLPDGYKKILPSRIQGRKEASAVPPEFGARAPHSLRVNGRTRRGLAGAHGRTKYVSRRTLSAGGVPLWCGTLVLFSRSKQ